VIYTDLADLRFYDPLKPKSWLVLDCGSCLVEEKAIIDEIDKLKLYFLKNVSVPSIGSSWS